MTSEHTTRGMEEPYECFDWVGTISSSDLERALRSMVEDLSLEHAIFAHNDDVKFFGMLENLNIFCDCISILRGKSMSTR